MRKTIDNNMCVFLAASESQMHGRDFMFYGHLLDDHTYEVFMTDQNAKVLQKNIFPTVSAIHDYIEEISDAENVDVIYGVEFHADCIRELPVKIREYVFIDIYIGAQCLWDNFAGNYNYCEDSVPFDVNPGESCDALAKEDDLSWLWDMDGKDAYDEGDDDWLAHVIMKVNGTDCIVSRHDYYIAKASEDEDTN